LRAKRLINANKKILQDPTNRLSQINKSLVVFSHTGVFKPHPITDDTTVCCRQF